jgi:hypothetical protein
MMHGKKIKVCSKAFRLYHHGEWQLLDRIDLGCSEFRKKNSQTNGDGGYVRTLRFYQDIYRDTRSLLDKRFTKIE